MKLLSYIEEKAMRSSGVLMHITSLPGPYGVGTMGKEAYAFVDFLKESGQSYWQILPLTPTGYGDSPYQSCSAFAGNYYLIDLDTLIAEGLLKKKTCRESTGVRKKQKQTSESFTKTACLYCGKHLTGLKKHRIIKLFAD